MIKTTSQGLCKFCDKEFKKAGINRHLSKHLEEKELRNKAGTSFLLKIGTDSNWGNTPYFLSVWMDGNTDLELLDYFLRQIWLECCGHLSSFKNPQNRKKNGGFISFFEAEEFLEQGKIKKYEKAMEDMSGEVPMSRKAKKVFEQGLTLKYEYDYGSTTALDITCVKEFNTAADKPIALLSRNKPLDDLCDVCKNEPALEICTVCLHDDGDQIFCKSCAIKHAKKCDDFADYASAPMVNSPRMGVCGYDGDTDFDPADY
jgi:hypothetical protein